MYKLGERGYFRVRRMLFYGNEKPTIFRTEGQIVTFDFLPGCKFILHKGYSGKYKTYPYDKEIVRKAYYELSEYYSGLQATNEWLHTSAKAHSKEYSPASTAHPKKKELALFLFHEFFLNMGVKFMRRKIIEAHNDINFPNINE